MNETEFNGLSNELLLEGFHRCSNSSLSLFESANAVAERKHFGIANSLLILSVEEGQKALLYFAKLIYENETIEVGDVFFKHPAKHKQGQRIYNATRFGVEATIHALKTIEKNKKSYLNKSKDEQALIAAHLSNDKLQELLKKNAEVSGEEKMWWDIADTKKKNGFYVDLKNGEWASPDEITEKEFLLSQKIVSNHIGSLFILGNAPEEIIVLIKKTFQAAKILV